MGYCKIGFNHGMENKTKKPLSLNERERLTQIKILETILHFYWAHLQLYVQYGSEFISFAPFVFPLVVKAFQEYTEPEDATPSSPQRRTAAAGEDEAVVLPLGDNTLTHNLGIPVLIVCTKVNNSYTSAAAVLVAGTALYLALSCLR